MAYQKFLYLTRSSICFRWVPWICCTVGVPTHHHIPTLLTVQWQSRKCSENIQNSLEEHTTSQVRHKLGTSESLQYTNWTYKPLTSTALVWPTSLSATLHKPKTLQKLSNMLKAGQNRQAKYYNWTTRSLVPLKQVTQCDGDYQLIPLGVQESAKTSSTMIIYSGKQ